MVIISRLYNLSNIGRHDLLTILQFISFFYINLPTFLEFIKFFLIKSNLYLYQAAFINYVGSIFFIFFIGNV